ncbi:hypothetical protein MVEN_01786800 [Mycena venus]|uniref:Uncharacterized protein n=1 Tax=Mycena venus TaxID=2733690 RepID=A0A8H7CN27_9AGAR|nr:hypothetical protein MVEN_01786800 [Mycena venus]
MEFDYAPKILSYMDAMETSLSKYMDSEYLRYPPSPSSFEQSMDRFPPQPHKPRPHPQRSLLLVVVIVAPFNPLTRPYTPNDGAGISPPSLRTGEMSWNGLTSGRRSRGSSSHSPPATFSAGSAAAASAVPRSHSLSSHCFNPIRSPPHARPRLAQEPHTPRRR